MKQTPNWEELVELARDGQLYPLHHALNDLSAQLKAFERRKVEAVDLPECVLQFLRDQLAPSGKPGMPERSEWELFVIKSGFEQLRDLLQIAKKTGATDAKGAVLSEVKGVTPTERALDVIGENLSLSPHSVRDIVYHDRKKTKKSKG